MGKPLDKHPNANHYAAGLKTAVLVCVIGFIAFAANHALVAPGGGASPVDMHVAPAASVSEPAVPVLAPVPASMSASAPASESDSATTYDGGDNHPPTF